MGTVLLVEDDDALAERVGQLLREAGHEVSHAPDSLAALKAVGAIDRRLDLLVTTVRMPPHKPHGFALARMARARRPGLAVIYLADAETPELTDEIAVGPVLSKPLTAEALAAAIEDALRQQRSDAAPA